MFGNIISKFMIRSLCFYIQESPYLPDIAFNSLPTIDLKNTHE